MVERSEYHRNGLHNIHRPRCGCRFVYDPFEIESCLIVQSGGAPLTRRTPATIYDPFRFSVRETWTGPNDTNDTPTALRSADNSSTCSGGICCDQPQAAVLNPFGIAYPERNAFYQFKKLGTEESLETICFDASFHQASFINLKLRI